MKNIFYSIAVLFILMGCNESDSKNTTETTKASETEVMEAKNAAGAISDSANYTTIEWLDPTKQELGKIKEGQTPEISWKFRNTGAKPLIIINAQGTCGCTIAEKPEQPVAPGEEGVIKAKFSSEGRPGVNEKQVIVTTNTQGNSTHYLNFKVEVLKQ